MESEMTPVPTKDQLKYARLVLEVISLTIGIGLGLVKVARTLGLT